MPFSFLLVLAFVSMAFISPLVGAGIIWALYVKRWHEIAGRAGKLGGVGAAIFIGTFFALNALSADGTPIQGLSVAIAGGAGFTSGAMTAAVWLKITGRSGRVSV